MLEQMEKLEKRVTKVETDSAVINGKLDLLIGLNALVIFIGILIG